MFDRILQVIQAAKELQTEIYFFILCALFWLIGTFKIDTNSIDVRNQFEIPPFALGALFLVLGITYSLLSRSKSKPPNKIVFYSPTLKANPFFHEILDHTVEIATRKNIQVVVQKGVTTALYHYVDDYRDVLSHFTGKDYKNTVIIMIPPSPDSYSGIFRFEPTTKINLITLDMEVDEYSDKFLQCDFLKQVILIDNKKGCELAAEDVVSYCKSQNIKSVNIITCEGELHNRGKYFRQYIDELAAEREVEVEFLDRLEPRSFSRAVGEAYNHVIQTITTRWEDVEVRTTFIFCANDNMAMGARVALSSYMEPGAKADIKIISFDASDTIRNYIELNDQYIYKSVDQKYYEYAKTAVEYAEMIFDGEKFERKVTYITPEIYRK